MVYTVGVADVVAVTRNVCSDSLVSKSPGQRFLQIDDPFLLKDTVAGVMDRVTWLVTGGYLVGTSMDGTEIRGRRGRWGGLGPNTAIVGRWIEDIVMVSRSSRRSEGDLLVTWGLEVVTSGSLQVDHGRLTRSGTGDDEDDAPNGVKF